MNKLKFSNKPINQLRLILNIPAAVILLLVMGYIIFYGLQPNPAKDAAQTLEQALVDAGAVKRCEISVAGKGPDNFQPGYEGRYTLTATKNTAEELINKIAKDKGYNLAHQDSPYEYIEWYSDKTSKPDTSLTINLYSDGDKLGCTGESTFQLDEGHVGVTMSVTLVEGR